MNKITFKLQNTTKEKEEEIFNFLKNHCKIGWVVFCSGAWDVIIVAYTKDLYEYSSLVKEINEKYGKYIHTKEFIAHPDYYVCNRKWLSINKENIISHIGGPTTKQDIDSKDLQIIKILAQNARTPILEIAKKTKISSPAIIKRMRNLRDKKIILNYRIGINLEKIGKEFCKSFICLQNVTKESEQKIIEYCLDHPNVTALTNSIGPWDMELEMEVKNFDEFYNMMKNLKNEFKDFIKNYEAVVITKEYGINYSNIIDF